MMGAARRAGRSVMALLERDDVGDFLDDIVVPAWIVMAALVCVVAFCVIVYGLITVVAGAL